jgi:hypothetical protein
MKKILVIFMTFLTLAAVAETPCFPENSLYNPVGMKSMNGIEEADFRGAIADVKKVYSPIFKDQYGSNLIVEEKWEDSTVNAYAQQSGKNWKVSMFGGLARDPEVTKDGFIAVICHEIGHHIGGAPKKSTWMGTAWASNEGQSDYFATSKCLKRLFKDELELNKKALEESDKTEDRLIALNKCKEVYKSEAEVALCYRSALAGESLAKLLGKLGGTPNVAFGTPDLTEVSKTNHNHPKGQCRMDTYFEGALCDRDFAIWPSNEDAAVGYCGRKDNFKIGTRPLCWFKPKS